MTAYISTMKKKISSLAMEGSNSSKIVVRKERTTKTTTKTKKKNKEEKYGDLISNTTTIDDLALTKTGTCLIRVESDSMGTIEVPAENTTSDKYFLCETKQLIYVVFAIDKGSKDIQ
jgi:hypothetical protein